MSYDGNFQNGRKAKKVAKDDICLSDGLQYFVRHAAYELWAKIGGSERQVCQMSHYGAEANRCLSIFVVLRKVFVLNAIITRLEGAIPMGYGVVLTSLVWGSSVAQGIRLSFRRVWSTIMGVKSTYRLYISLVDLTLGTTGSALEIMGLAPS